jgi:hypothetical protein
MSGGTSLTTHKPLVMVVVLDPYIATIALLVFPSKAYHVLASSLFQQEQVLVLLASKSKSPKLAA